MDETKNNLHPCPKEITTDDSTTKVLVIPANEELMIAEETFELLEEERCKNKEAV